jgi:glycerophosphoryl diester phosphodiesterase
MRAHYAYRPRGPLLHDLLDGESDEKTPFLLFDEALTWARREHRLRTLFVDVKLLEDETDAAAHLFDELRAACGAGDWRPNLVVALLCTEREILETLLERAELWGLPECLRIYADFELPGVLEDAGRLGIRNVSMGCGERAWADFRRELAMVIAARQAGELDSVVVWTVNDAELLEELVQLRVDAILTDDVAALRDLLARSG